MKRVASLYLPQLPIERLHRLERPAMPPDGAPLHFGARFPEAIDDNPGACSVPRGGGWRSGARWAQADIDALPAHQRPTMREMGRRSEAADNPFKTMRADDGVSGGAKPLRARGWQGRPTILIERIGQREAVAAACPLALDLGLRPGMAAAHARALVTDLEVRDAEPERDHAWLERLALHAVARWTPTANMIRTQPERYKPYAAGLPGGLNNPLGARALYLYRNGRDTHFRLHGTLEPYTIGQQVSSGCIRLINQDIIDLYNRVPTGTKVVVLS